MKFLKSFFLLALHFITCAQLYAAPMLLSYKATNRIATLTKVWGLMKYYHPEVAAGNINWDSAFVAYAPKVAEAKSKQEFQGLMDEMYSLVPAPKLAAKYNLPKADTIVAVFSSDEIAGYDVGPKLKQQLKDMYERHLPVESKYITNKYKEYTLDYVRFLEKPMTEAAYPDKETRLLALARYWNTINYFYPHKHTIGKSWESVLMRYIPAFVNASNELAYHKAILRLNKELEDSHTFVNSPVINSMWGPNPHFMVDYIEDKFVITKVQSDSLAQAEGIKVGDVIISINGKPVKQRVKELWPLMKGSNEISTYRDIANYLLNVDGNDFATIEVLRNGARLTRKISRYPYQQLVKLSDKPNQDKLWWEVERGIMYVNYTKIRKPDVLNRLFKEMQNASSVILDLRGYPSFQVYQQTLPALFSMNFHVSNSSNALVSYPGFFSVSNNMFERTDTSSLLPYNGGVIVLVNETTQSLPESFAMGLAQRPNTIIMGSQTAGTTGNITWLPMPGGANIAFTGVGELGVKGTFEQREGVRIDKVVKPTVASVAAGKDAVLEAAVAEARKELKLKAEVNK